MGRREYIVVVSYDRIYCPDHMALKLKNVYHNIIIDSKTEPWRMGIRMGYVSRSPCQTESSRFCLQGVNVIPKRATHR